MSFRPFRVDGLALVFDMGIFIMKECSRCLLLKSKLEFGNQKNSPDGLSYICKGCDRKKGFEYNRTRDGIITKILSSQKKNSKRRGHEAPAYNKQEFKDWMLSRPNFEPLYLAWVSSNYNRDLKLSVDRLDDNLPYSIDNIQLMTWGENYRKSRADIQSGKLRTNHKVVIGTNINTGEKIEFDSLKEAANYIGVDSSNITKCCTGIQGSSGGYSWRHK